MTLQSSGTIRMSEINSELGRSSTATISLDTAENGGYATINTNSTSRPSSTNPAAMSEWYSYNHSAPPPGYDLGVTLYTLISGASPQFEYYNTSTGYNLYVDLYNTTDALAGNAAGTPFDQLAYVNSAYTQDISVTVYLNSSYIYGIYDYTDWLTADSYGLFTMPSSNSNLQVYIQN